MAEEKIALKEKIKETKDKLAKLSSQITKAKRAKDEKSPLTADMNFLPVTGRLRTRRRLAGHFGKVVSVTWDRTGERALTASQDGNVIVWNAISAKKAHLVPLKSSWVMFAEVTQSGKEIFATGGLDNVASIWTMPSVGGAHKLEAEYFGHEGYVCGARFLDDTKLLTTSGDRTTGLWNLHKPQSKKTDKDVDDRVAVFKGHDKDVTSVDVKPSSIDHFATSSTDGTCMLWSLNQPSPTGVLRLLPPEEKDGSCLKRHTDINKCRFMPNGFAVGLATETMGSRLYDIRTMGQMNAFDSTTPDYSNSSKYSIAFSKSGRLAFVACDDCSIEVWDTLKPDQTKPLHQLNSIHASRVTDIAVPSTGYCVGAASWDTFGSITAP